MASEIHPTPLIPKSREVRSYQRRRRMARWAIVANLTTFFGIASSSVIIDIRDQSGPWSHWVVLGAAVIATIHVAVIERPRVRGWLLQRQFKRPSDRGKRDVR